MTTYHDRHRLMARVRSRLSQRRLFFEGLSGESMSAKDRSEKGPSGNTGATIVLVDDNDDVREVTAMLLSKLGYSVIGAESGTKALNLLESGTVADLLMVDFSMPDMSGIELWPRCGVSGPH